MDNEFIIDERMQDLIDTSITQEEKEQTYPMLVERFIRQRYTISQELAIQRQRDSKKEEFDIYDNYCEDCKAKAKEILNM